MKREDEFKTVITLNDPISAQMVAGMLNDNGIPAGVFCADSSYPCLNYGHPVEVKVNADDFERALELVPEEDRVQD